MSMAQPIISQKRKSYKLSAEMVNKNRVVFNEIGIQLPTQDSIKDYFVN